MPRTTADKRTSQGGRVLAEARLNAGHSVRSLAAHLDLSEQSIHRLEDGKGITPASAKKLADYFGLKVTDLMPVEAEQADAA